MIIDYFFKNKTINRLRKDKGLTVKELSDKVNVTPSVILKVEKTKLKKVPDALYHKLYNVLEP